MTAQRCYGIPSYWTEQAASASTDFVRTILIIFYISPLSRDHDFLLDPSMMTSV